MMITTPKKMKGDDDLIGESNVVSNVSMEKSNKLKVHLEECK